jgi:hypothetical protein
MRIVIAMAIPIFAAGCDPGWTYHVQSRSTPTSGLSSAIADADRLSLNLLEARLFAGGLHIRTTVVNGLGHVTPLDSASLQIFDRSGNILTPSRVSGCSIGYPQSRLSSCSPEADLSVRPTIALSRRNPALEQLTVRVAGVTRSGRGVVLILPLEWDN